jgi:hypothetical protein
MHEDILEPVIAFAKSPAQKTHPFGAPAFRALFERARSLPRDARGELVSGLLPSLEVEDAFQASAIALACGTLVEYGASPKLVALPILHRFMRALTSTEGQVDGRAFSYFALASMAHLARDVSMRIEARRIDKLREALASAEEVEPNITFVLRTLDLVDDMTLLVLAPQTSRGFRVRIEGVQTNFHLFTLLQGALIGEGLLAGEPTSPEVLAVAQGKVAELERLHDHQRFHFHNWSAITADGTLHNDLGSTLWGESTPHLIPRHEGTPVVVLGPPLLGARTWDSGFFANYHDALRSSATVTATLGEAEVREVLASIAARS